MPKQNSSPRYLIVGEILRPHGVRGEMRVKIITDYPERLLDEVEYLYVGKDPDQAAEQYEVLSARFHQTYILVQLEGIDDRDVADSLRGQYLMVDIDHAVPLDDGEYYLYQLIGMNVVTVSGEEIGIIAEVMETGANDVYVINSRKYGQILLPAHEETLVEIDLEKKQIVMDLPDGLLPQS